MDDLFVTFPKEAKNEERFKPSLEHFKENIDGFDFFIYKIGNKFPAKRRITKGGKCYIGFNNKVQGYFIFDNARFVPKKEAKAFGHWDGSEGNFIFCDYASFKPLNGPKYLRGFTGFRYYQDEIERKNID